MKKVFKSGLINFIILLVFIALFIKIIFFTVSLFLPINGISKSKNSIDSTFYYSFVASFKQVQKVKPKKDFSKVKNTTKCKDLTLTAVYDDGKDKQFAAISKGKKDYIISIQDRDSVEGYILVQIGIDEDKNGYAILEKNSKPCKIKFKEDKIDYSKYIPVKEEIVEPKNDENSGIKKVEKDKIDFYTNPKNFKNIWENISIMPNRQDGVLNGYKISFVKKGSDFDKIGLKKGDIIKAVNSKEIKKDSDGFEIYKKVKNMKEFKLTILRDNNIKEIEYAIK